MKNYEQHVANSRAPVLLPLTASDESDTTNLQAVLREAGCVFHFSINLMADGSDEATEAQHRFALQGLFDALQAENLAHWQRLVAKDSAYRSQILTPLNHGVDKAACMPLDAHSVVPAVQFPPGHRVAYGRDLKTVSWFEWLAQSFDNPPYGMRTEDPEMHRALFPSFCKATGLLPDNNITVLDWVGDCGREPERSEWSPYFEEGKEWWGIWCLTVWNPKHRTLAAIAASATD